MKRVGLVVKNDVQVRAQADRFERWLADQGVKVIRRVSTPPEQSAPREEPARAPHDLFCVFVLGGDGTFLGAVRWLGGQAIPVLGVKFGQVGFLAAGAENNLYQVAQEILEGRFTTTERMRLAIEVRRGGRCLLEGSVLNDVVINKGALARLADIHTEINDRYLTTYKADGLIVATPTGSTAYALAAGGPIVHPAVPCILLAPICPFTLTNRPLIIPETSTIKLTPDPEATDIFLTFDGQSGLPLCAADEIRIRKSPNPVHMIRISGQNYFDVLKAKLSWSGGRV
ncbi:MAG: NAD(+)/NADH kinase [Desulfobacterales bacterium]